jgi:hypothetical protein
MIRYWIGIYNAINMYRACKCIISPKCIVESYTGSSLLFCYRGEIEIIKRLGLTYSLSSLMGFAIILFGPDIICKILCMLYMLYSIGLYMLAKYGTDYWCPKEILESEVIIMVSFGMLLI